jgi:predicted Fe-Mo cluster-binding NifX family protein
MKVGIATWDGRLSPVFDVARYLLVVDVEDNTEVGRRQMSLEESQLASRARRLTELGVQVLICGAISRPLEAMLVSAGVHVIPQTCGPVEDVLQAFLQQQLANDAFLMPGCCGRRRRFRRGQCRDGRRGASP